MNAKRRLFLVVVATVEASIGLGLLLLPSVPFALLLGLQSDTVEAIFVGRVAGAALLGGLLLRGIPSELSGEPGDNRADP